MKHSLKISYVSLPSSLYSWNQDFFDGYHFFLKLMNYWMIKDKISCTWVLKVKGNNLGTRKGNRRWSMRNFYHSTSSLSSPFKCYIFDPSSAVKPWFFDDSISLKSWATGIIFQPSSSSTGSWILSLMNHKLWIKCCLSWRILIRMMAQIFGKNFLS